MGENSKIEWCRHTFNPWMGCTKVSAGCDHCYAEALMDTRYGKVKWGPHGERVRTSASNWRLPLRWARQARNEIELFDVGMTTIRPERPRVFCASLADVFDNQAPASWRLELYDLIERTPELDWLLLTKRPENIAKMYPPLWMDSPPAHVWLGTTCEDQAAYDRRWPILSRVPARVRFISYEPAIGPLKLTKPRPARYPDWLICGGESGSSPRLMPEAWAESAMNECAQLDIAFFMKQMTAKAPIPAHLASRQLPDARLGF